MSWSAFQSVSSKYDLEYIIIKVFPQIRIRPIDVEF